MEEFDSTDVIAFVTQPVVIEVFGVVFATLVANYLTRQFFKRLSQRAAKTETVWDDALVAAIQRPAALLIWVLGISFAAQLISAETESQLSQLIDPVRYVLCIGVFTMFAISFVAQCEKGFILNGADVTTANAISKLLRASIFITAALTVLQTLGVSIQGLLAFGGVGGLAVGFAARDILSNFFGGLMIYLDRPFAVGDWVRSPDRDIEGTVENIGWRLTIIRTFDQRPLYVPNSVFAAISLENPSRMRNRRIYETIGVRYDDASKVKLIVDDVRQMLVDHPEIAQDRTMIVNFNSFGASSLDFFIYCFTKTTNWVEFHGIKQEVLLKIQDIILGHGAEIAFPTTTVHLEQAEPEQLT
jgi:MscS family membrane protein